MGVTIVRLPRRRASAPVMPRILGTIPPSRTGSSPLHRWSQPVEAGLLPGRLGMGLLTSSIGTCVLVMTSSHFDHRRLMAGAQTHNNAGHVQGFENALCESLRSPI